MTLERNGAPRPRFAIRAMPAAAVGATAPPSGPALQRLLLVFKSQSPAQCGQGFMAGMKAVAGLHVQSGTHL